MRTLSARGAVDVLDDCKEFADRAPMKTQLPIRTEEPVTSDEEHRVLQFRPRPLSRSSHNCDEPGKQRPQDRKPDLPEPNDLSRYERDRSPPDDFHHRMLANAAASGLTAVLIAIGIWLAMSIAELRNLQDCVLMGRRDCGRISTPHI
jgi:hypothetical protein